MALPGDVLLRSHGKITLVYTSVFGIYIYRVKERYTLFSKLKEPDAPYLLERNNLPIYMVARYQNNSFLTLIS